MTKNENRIPPFVKLVDQTLHIYSFFRASFRFSGSKQIAENFDIPTCAPDPYLDCKLSNGSCATMEADIASDKSLQRQCTILRNQVAQDYTNNVHFVDNKTVFGINDCRTKL